MGFIGNIIMAGAVHHHNHRRNGISHRLFGAVPNTGNVVICGGDTTSEESFATDIKVDSLIESIVQAAKDHKPTICIYSDDSITPDILDLLNDDSLKDSICFFGHSYSYIPFDKNVDSHKVEEMMRGIVNRYNKNNNSYGDTIQTIMSMMIDILKKCFSKEYFTYSNLANIINNFMTSNGEDVFLDWLAGETTANLTPFENRITIKWDVAINEFQSFWTSLDSEVNVHQNNNLKKRSAFSCLLDNKVCIFRLSSNYSKNMVELLLNELAFYKDVRQNYTLINYNVDISVVSNYRLLDAGRSIIIGNTLDSIGMKEYNPPRSSFVSLGITNEEAMDIFKKMVASGWWTEVMMGFGHHAHVEFAPKHQEPIPPDVLVNIRDGSAYVISPERYTQVDIMFA